MHSVLLVVDDEQLLATLGSKLAQLGHEVVSARSVEGALAEGSSRSAQVIVVDVVDASVAERLAAAHRLGAELDAPVVYLTSPASEEVVDVEARARASAYILKPVSVRELASAIELAAFRRRAERDAAARDRWYRTTLRSIADAVITADEEARITFMNPTAETLTGWSEAEALGAPLNDVFKTEAPVADGSAQSEEAGQPLLRLQRRAGAPVLIEHNASPIVEDGGALHGVVVVFRDIGERHRIEHRLLLSDRMASIGTLAAGVAHELNNPLAFVTSNLEFVIAELTRLSTDSSGASGDGEWRTSVSDSLDALREARDGANRAASIVKDMKVFMRADNDPKILVDVNRAVALAMRLTSNEIKHHGELTSVLGDLPLVFADEGKLVQVLVNVLTNAAQSLDDKPAHRISVTTSRVGGHVNIAIKDTGRGIAPEHLARVFEPFFTTKAVGEGLGLGLSIAHSIVSAFGGSLSVDSVLKEGTTLTISLPLPAEVKAPAPVVQAPAAKPVTKARVLVVDDEALIGTAIRRILTKHGLDVVVEGQGRAGFERLCSGEKFDVVLCDLMMPEFSGVDLYEGLDSTRPEMKSRIVFMTGNAFTPRASELFETTKNVRLEKPFVPADLTRAINEVMRRHGDDSEI